MLLRISRVPWHGVIGELCVLIWMIMFIMAPGNGEEVMFLLLNVTEDMAGLRMKL